jgi:hypothetical protein
VQGVIFTSIKNVGEWGEEYEVFIKTKRGRSLKKTWEVLL